METFTHEVAFNQDLPFVKLWKGAWDLAGPGQRGMENLRRGWKAEWLAPIGKLGQRVMWGHFLASPECLVQEMCLHLQHREKSVEGIQGRRMALIGPEHCRHLLLLTIPRVSCLKPTNTLLPKGRTAHASCQCSPYHFGRGFSSEWTPHKHGYLSVQK